MAGRRIGKSLAGVLAVLVGASLALAQAPPADRALLETLHEAGQAFRRSLAEPNATIAAVDEARQKLEHETGRLAGRGASAEDQRIVDLYVAAARGYQEARNRFGADHSREHYLADVRQIETELAQADNLFQGAPPIVPAVVPTAPTPPPPAPPQKRPQEHTVPVPPADLAPPAPVPPPMPPAHSPEPPTHATPPTPAPAKRPSQSTPPASPPASSPAAPPAPPVASTPPPTAASVAPPQAAAPQTAPPAPPKSAPAPEELPKATTAQQNPQPAPIVPPPPSAPSAVAPPPAPPAPVPESHAVAPAPPAPVVTEPPPAAPPAPAAASAEPSPAPGPSGPRHGPPIVSRAPIPTTPTGVRKAADKVRIEKNAGAVVDRCSLLGEVTTGDVRSGVHEIGGHNFLYEDALGLARLMTVEAGGDTLLLRERTKAHVTGDAYRCSPNH